MSASIGTVRIFDTTLRDGEQTPGASLTPEEKVVIARQLDRLGVDAIEAGTPITSKGEWMGVKLVAREGLKAEIYGLVRMLIEDVDAVLETDVNHVHLFIATSDIHLIHKLRMTREQALQRTLEIIDYAKDHGLLVEFSAEDASRTGLAYLKRVYKEVDEAGVTRINIPDTVGIMTPKTMYNLVNEVKSTVKTPLSVHCHNDFGMAVANTLAGVEAGADQAQVSVNGLGERAGNASLEEVVIAHNLLYKKRSNVVPELIYQTSQLVARLTGIPVQPNKAIVGANAFRHESGIHQDGVIKMPITYEIIDPRIIGIPSSSLVLGKLSGRHAFRERLAELGYNLSNEDLNRAFTAFKELAEKKKEVTDRDIESLVAEEKRTVSEVYHIDRIQVTCGDRGIPTAAVRLIDPDGKVLADAALGTGPVDAVYKAINRIVGVPNQLTEFSVKSVTEGIDAIGEVLIRIESDGITYTGRGADTDIIVSSAKAYINALNRLLAAKNKSA